MQVSTTFKIERGEEIITIEAEGYFSQDEQGLYITRWDYDHDVELDGEEADALIDKLYMEARS